MIDLNNLSAEQKAQLKAQLENEERAEKARVQNEREAYKDLVDATVTSAVKKLQILSDEMMRVKAEVFAEFETLIKTKNELFATKQNPQSDTSPLRQLDAHHPRQPRERGMGRHRRSRHHEGERIPLYPCQG